MYPDLTVMLDLGDSRRPCKILLKEKTFVSGMSYFESFGYLWTGCIKLGRTATVYEPTFAQVNSFANGAYRTGGVGGTGITCTVVPGVSHHNYPWYRYLTAWKYLKDPLPTPSEKTTAETRMPYYTCSIPAWLKAKGFDVIIGVKAMLDENTFANNYSFANQDRCFVFVNRSSSGDYYDNMIGAMKYEQYDNSTIISWGKHTRLPEMSTAFTKDTVTFIPDLFAPLITEDKYAKVNDSTSNGLFYTWTFAQYPTYFKPKGFIIRCAKSSVLDAQGVDY